MYKPFGVFGVSDKRNNSNKAFWFKIIFAGISKINSISLSTQNKNLYERITDSNALTINFIIIDILPIMRQE